MSRSPAEFPAAKTAATEVGLDVGDLRGALVRGSLDVAVRRSAGPLALSGTSSYSMRVPTTTPGARRTAGG